MCLPDFDHRWDRFAIPSGTTPTLDRDLLPDSSGEFGPYINPRMRPFVSLRDAHCVVLLGDPGIGKSDVFRNDLAAIHTANSPQHQGVLCRVGDYTDDVLIDRFFDSQVFEEWQDSDSTLSVFIDGLDEGLLRGNGWAGILRGRLQQWSGRNEHFTGAAKGLLNRLRLRISCRPGLWPENLGRLLESLYSDGNNEADAENPIKWDLLPLREEDVRLSAREHQLNPDRFMREIEKANAFSFASRPLTLKLLLRTMTDEGQLPTTHVLLTSKCFVGGVRTSSMSTTAGAASPERDRVSPANVVSRSQSGLRQ